MTIRLFLAILILSGSGAAQGAVRSDREAAEAAVAAYRSIQARNEHRYGKERLVFASFLSGESLSRVDQLFEDFSGEFDQKGYGARFTENAALALAAAAAFSGKPAEDIMVVFEYACDACKRASYDRRKNNIETAAILSAASVISGRPLVSIEYALATFGAEAPVRAGWLMFAAQVSGKSPADILPLEGLVTTSGPNPTDRAIMAVGAALSGRTAGEMADLLKIVNADYGFFPDLSTHLAAAAAGYNKLIEKRDRLRAEEWSRKLSFPILTLPGAGQTAEEAFRLNWFAVGP